MELKDQVCDLKYAKQLEKLRVKQNGYWSWCIGKLNEAMFLCHYEEGMVLTLTKPIKGSHYIQDVGEQYSAFTVAELGEMLPEKFSIMSCKRNNFWVCNNYPLDTISEILANTEANARAEMLIWLIENKYLEL